VTQGEGHEFNPQYRKKKKKEKPHRCTITNVCFLGIGALTFALLMSARMGIFQETLYKQFGKHSKEALFYNVSNFLNLEKVKIPEL
jgi:hypothetical protein